ncbi:telomere-associated protein RIF1 isoform X2 [Catharus ustulatus]|uniref:telomere-associated protein RIF1 isoform X2 n=1 Tax=Catharus ustulatus TaxID=91951 RepID=UPI00140AD367|nr:telomere-associated protein RIF1 isoform X2 [Catharus ustulatus]
MSAPGPDPDPAAPDPAAPDPAAGSSFGPLLQTLEDPSAPPGELTDAHLTIVSRFTGEGGKSFIADVRKHFPQLCKVFKAHISSPNLELSNAALQALGFCTFNSSNTAELSATESQELLAAVNSVAVKSSDKNTRTRALWVISKQAFPPEIVQKEVSNILSTLEAILTKGEVQSVVVEYEALNVIIRLVEQTPAQMGEEAVRWAKLILPLVVHSAHKVQLRGATALEMGMPLLLQKQQEVAAVTEHLMTTKLISELQKLFSAKNETFVLKLWPLFVRLLGKTLHRSGSFINSLLQLEELGFRSGSPVVKKIAFIAWKSLIDNFALNPDILCSAKRLKLLMQPLSSIHVRTEALALTKLEVWWYLLMRLGPHLPSNFEQVCVPLIQSTLSVDPAAAFPGTPSRPNTPSLGSATPGQKSGPFPFVSPGTPRMALGSPAGVLQFPSIQLLAIEMLLHFLMGPQVVDFAKQNKLVLSLEPLQYPLISSPSFFCKHASTLINAVQDGFVAIGKEVPDCLLNVIWKDMNGYVKTAIEAGNKKEKQGSEILTMLLQALKNTVRSNSLPVQKILSLIDITVKELPPKVLGSPAYQVADMDLLNGTPALFLIQLLFHNNLLDCCVTDERFFEILETLVGFALSGPTSALAFSDSVLGVIAQSAKQLGSKEHLCRMWSIVVNPLTEWINQNNEVNQGDALEHNFSAVYSALLLPVSHIFPTQGFPQPTLKSLLRSWSDLYRAFARCAALVATAEENLCCEELCAKILSGLEGETPVVFPMLEGLTHLVSVMVDCINFAPYGTKFQPKNRSPQTPTDWAKKKKEPLGKLSSLFKLLLLLLSSFHELSSQEELAEPLGALGPSLLGALHALLSHIALPSLLGAALGIFGQPLALFYERNRLPEAPKVYSNLNNKLEKLLAEILQCLQCHCPGSCDSELLQQLSPLLCVAFQHRNKQLRQQSAQLWNCTFAKASSLTYPQELKSVLSQAKKKIPLLLPGFESIEMSEECSGPFSDMMENSQLDATIGGMDVKVGQKRDSILAQTSEPKNDGKDKSSNVQATPAKLKLEFSSPKTTSEKLLEEEKSVDFVFIPPETKPRILTEHQKEVLRSKRADIPAMYNTLDASQDTSSFSQYTQSQEDSLEVPPLVENAKEEPADQAQEEKAESEGCHSEESPACSGEGEAKNETAEMIPEEPSIGEAMETSSVEAASQEAPAEKEDTSNVTSSSTSSDIISGTPQPVSRRQSFITLEKFGSAESRPFSPAPLSSVLELPGTVPEAAPQENSSGSKASAKAEKSGEENKDTPKCERRVTRRQSKMELQGNKSKLQGRSEESLASDSLEGSAELGSAGEDALLSQSQALPSSEPDSQKTEDAAPEAENSQELDMDSKENTPPDSSSCSEQTPGDESQVPAASPHQKQLRRSARRRPETLESSGSQEREDGLPKRDRRKEEVKKEDGLPKRDKKKEEKEDGLPKRDKKKEEKEDGLPKRDRRKEEKEDGLPKKDRRKEEEKKEVGLPKRDRRKEEEKKEDGFTKKDRRKEEEKAGQKKLSQGKGDGSQKQKGTPGKTTESTKESSQAERVAEERSSRDSAACKGLEEEGSRGGRRAEDSPKPEGEAQGSLSTAGQRVERPRYHTRRSSQGLLSSLENSEADSSEGKEESTKKKKAIKVKSKSNSLEGKLKEGQAGSQSLEESSQENEAKSPVEPSKGDAEVSTVPAAAEPAAAEPADPGGLESQEIPATAGEAVGSGSSESSGALQDTSVEQSKGDASMESLSSPCVSEQDGKAAEESKQEEKQSSPEDCAEAASDAEPSSVQSHVCQSKRSKRVKKMKSCDCCFKKPKQQVTEEKLTELKKEEDPELEEAESSPAQTPEDVCGHSDLEESLALAPCGMSTPMHTPKELNTFSLESQGMALENLEGSSVVVEEEKPENPEGSAAESTESMEEIKEPAEQKEQTEQVLPESVAEEPRESCLDSGDQGEEPAAAEKEEINENGQLEEVPEELSVDSKPEEKEMKEREGDQEVKEAETSAVETCVPDEEMKDESVKTEIKVPENVALANTSVDSPLKVEGGPQVQVAESPTSLQARCTWSPSASPSTSILKRGVKRSQEDDSLSPANKIRRVSFANPIFQEGLADDIDRRSPVIRSHSSPSSRSLKILSNMQHITTPTKGFLSPGSRTLKFKSSKKCLITEMAKESLPCLTEFVYPALAGCKAPVDVILPQITSNICARGLGQLIRAKNIKTVGDLSTLTALEIKTLPIRSPKVSNVKRALKGYHEQQVKSRALEESSVFEDAEKPGNNVEEKPLGGDEEKLAADLAEAPPSSEQPPVDLLGQIQALAAQLSSEDLHGYSGRQLFEMQEKLAGMASCILRNLQARWHSPPHEGPE